MKLLLWSIVIAVALSLLWFVRNSRLMTETTPYSVVRTDGAFEIRDYPALVVVSTPMKPGAANASFNYLFGFITGKNAASEKIPMTVPVLVDPAPGRGSMGFILPKAVAEKGAPSPNNPEVRLNQREAGRYAVMRFRGANYAEDEKAAAQKLQAWLRDQKITAEGDPVFAYFDPPWTPVFLRRNEVMMRVGADAK